MKTLILLLALTACGRVEDPPDAEPANTAARDRFTAASARVLEHTAAGQVVSRTAAGAAERIGEARLWTWTAIGAMRCADARQLLDQEAARLRAAGGQATRFDPLPANYENGKLSLDSELGYWYGTAQHARRCPESRDLLAELWQLRQAAIDGNDGRIHPDVAQAIPPGFDAARDAVAHGLGLRGAPSADRLGALGAELAAWTGGVVVAHAACYRLNLAWDVLRAVEGASLTIPDPWRAAFCGAVARADVPLTDHWCGKPEALEAFLGAFAVDIWEYRHQRCAGWETPDGGGLSTPGLDELVALRELHGDEL